TFRQSDIAATAQQHAKLPTNPVTDVVTDDRTCCSGCDQHPNVQFWCFPGVTAAAISAVSPGIGTPMLSKRRSINAAKATKIGILSTELFKEANRSTTVRCCSVAGCSSLCPSSRLAVLVMAMTS